MVQTNGWQEPAWQNPNPVPQRPSGGGLAWGLGFIAIVPLPPLSHLASGIAMGMVGARQRREGGVAGAQGRYAANWGLTYALISALTMGVAFVVVILAEMDRGFADRWVWLAPTFLAVWGLATLLHLVCCIIGLVCAGSGNVFHCPAIPFVRAAPEDGPGHPDPEMLEPGFLAPTAPGYPGAGGPGHPAPGMGGPVDPRVAPPAPVQAAPTGAAAWGWGFLVYLPIPFIGQLIGGLVMGIVGTVQRRHPGAVGEIARRAGNWGYTYALGTVLLISLAMASGFLSDQLSPSGQQILGAVSMSFIVLWMIGNVVHIGVVVMGLVRASSGRALRVPAIPFLRKRRTNAVDAGYVAPPMH